MEVTEVINECKLAVTSMFYRFLAFASAFYRFLAVTSGFCRFLAVCKDMTLDLYTVTSGFYRFLAVTSAFYRFLAVMKQLDIVVCPTAFVWDPNLDIWYKNTALYQRGGTLYFSRYELLSSLIFGPVRTDRQIDRRTESDAYEPTVQSAQVGSKKQ